MNRKMISAILIFIFFSASVSILIFAGETGEAKYTQNQEFLFNVFKTRRSVRKFKSDPVPEHHILKIIDMARTAPTSGNQQPWKFLVITDREKVKDLKKELLQSYLQRMKTQGVTDKKNLEERKKRMTDYYSNYLSAPVNIIVLTDSQSKYPSYNRYDGPLAAGYLMLAARALGYGTVFATDSIPPQVTKKVFDIPDNFEVVCFTPLGVPENWPESKPKKPLDDFIVFNKFIEGVNYTRKAVKKAIVLDEQIKSSYTGRYKLNEQITITVSLKEGQLFVQLTGQPEIPIFPESETTFFLKVADATINFKKSADGKVKSLTLDQSGKKFNAELIK